MQARKGERKWVAGASGGIAGMLAETATLPIDTVKIRMQVNLGSGGEAPLGIVGTAQGIVKQEGIGGLYKGLAPGLLRQAVYQSIKMLIYEPIRDASIALLGDDAPELAVRLVAGGTAGVLGTAVSSPTDIMKVRMQADVAGTRYSGMIDAFAKTYRQEGIAAFWKGSTANMQRSFVVNASELAAYDTSKSILVGSYGWDGSAIATHAVCAFNAGFVAAVTSTPIDLAKTRIMNAGNGNVVYSGILDCLRTTVRNEGPMALYKGFLPNWFRLAPWTLVFFMSYENVRAAIGSVDATLQEKGF